ncbi:MAG TPA: IgGFc-binding protein, partial [bacterium]|nr:IgGFc-binding protein [bacterium]
MRNFICLLFLVSVLFISCTTSEDETCDINNPCPDGFTCNLLTGECEKEAVITDEEGSDDPALPVDNEKDDEDVVEKPDNEKPDEIIIKECEPDELVMCDPNDFYNILRCNSSGTGVDSVPCGEMLVCEDTKCVDQLCVPKTRVCSEEDNSKVFECSYTGTEVTDTVLEDCGVGGYCELGECLSYCDKAANEHSYQGCEYFTANLNTATRRTDPIWALTVSNLDSEKAVTVDITNFTETGEVDAGKCYFCVDQFCQSKTSSKGLTIDPGKLGIIQYPHDKMIKGTGVKWNSYHIKTNLPVTVYQFSPFDNSFDNPFETNGKSVSYNFLDPDLGRSFSNDASLLMPSASVYTDYIAATHKGGYQGSNTSKTYFTIIGVSDADTTVSIKPKVAVTAAGGVPAITAGSTGTVTIKKGQVVQVETTDLDVTGTRIFCDKNESTCHPFAVFSGTDCANVPIGYGWCDHLEQQMFPVQTWGKKYLLVKTKARTNEWDYVRIIASEDSTTLTFKPATPEKITVPSGWRTFTVNDVKTAINAGEYSEFYFKGTLEVESDKPVMVVQFVTAADMLSAECQTGDYDYHVANCPGDPAMMLIPPYEQFRKDYKFLTPGSYKSNYATVVMTTGEAPKINGSAVTGIKEITGTTFSYAIVDLGTEFKTHTLLCETNPCGLFVYGWEI